MGARVGFIVLNHEFPFVLMPPTMPTSQAHEFDLHAVFTYSVFLHHFPVVILERAGFS